MTNKKATRWLHLQGFLFRFRDDGSPFARLKRTLANPSLHLAPTKAGSPSTATSTIKVQAANRSIALVLSDFSVKSTSDKSIALSSTDSTGSHEICQTGLRSSCF